MFEIYEKIYGFDSEKTAKICMEMGQIYDLMNDLNEAIDYYNNSYKIWEKIITDDNYEVLFQLAILLSELYVKVDKGEDAYQILVSTDDNYSDKFQRSLKNRVVYQRCRIKASSLIKDMDIYLKENLKLEQILNEANENQKALAKTCINIGYIYLENKDKEKCIEYFEKAKKIFQVNGDTKLANDMQERIEDVRKKEEKQSEHESHEESHSD